MTVDQSTIDVHQHLLPPPFVEVLRKRTSPPRIVGAELEIAEGRFPFDPAENDVELRLAVIDRQGTDVAVLSLQHTLGHDALPPDERGELVAAWEEGIATVVADAGGRFAALAAGPTTPGFVGSSVGSDALRRPRGPGGRRRVGAQQRGLPVRSPLGRACTPEGTGAGGAHRPVHGADAELPTSRGWRTARSAGPTSRSCFPSLRAEGRSSSSASARADRRALRSSTAMSSSTRRHMDVARSSSVSRLSAWNRSSTAATCRSSTLSRRYRAVKGFGESVEKLIRCDNPNRLLA